MITISSLTITIKIYFLAKLESSSHGEEGEESDDDNDEDDDDDADEALTPNLASE